MSEAVVYFLYNPATRWTKIGATSDLEKRLKALRTQERQLILRHTIHVGPLVMLALESHLHRHFQACRIQLWKYCGRGRKGEWFALPSDWRLQAEGAFGDWWRSTGPPQLKREYQLLIFYGRSYRWSKDIVVEFEHHGNFSRECERRELPLPLWPASYPDYQDWRTLSSE